ncbi:hypothetical protein AC1031_005217 [Aphanomyces cochlioides]|nr:hypothetical protein AC1031_005217 [Aphanomyces cochlioides]
MLEPSKAAVVKEGALFKKGSGGLFKRKNWKLRYFELTNDELRYYDGHLLRGNVSLRQCTRDSIEIMLDSDPRTGSGGTIWRIAISTPSRRLLVACASEDDMDGWIDALYVVVDNNSQRKRRNTGKISLSHEATFIDNGSMSSNASSTTLSRRRFS